ncbi:MAG: single-stranded-DNA-specific exonuclease RecJ [Pseudomonadota bacterium]
MLIVERKNICKNNGLKEKVHPVLQRIYLARGIDDPEALKPGLGHLASPKGLSGLEQAAKLVVDAIMGQRQIVVVGDFDVDGATGVALALRALKALGAAQVNYCVPNRFSDGYGLTPALIPPLKDKGAELVITVDNGVSSIAGVAAARAAGMTVVITDHHLPGDTLPNAHALVNPNLPDSGFASPHLAGVGVMFYLLAAVRQRLVQDGRLRKEQVKLSQWLDLVALGTVADLVRLDTNNRILVAQGLARIRAGRCAEGISALCRIAGRDQGRLGAADLGFALAPRLNAAGRLSDMSTGIECLLTDDPGRAADLAAQLQELNSERRSVQADMEAEAQAIVEGLPGSPGNTAGHSLCLYEAGWHQGVVGLVASRVKDRWHRPVVAFAPEDAGSDVLKGSARSIAGFHIRDALALVAARHAGLIHRFGGHAMAAGLTLPAAHLEAFSEALEAVAAEQLAPEQLRQVVRTDGPLAGSDLNLDLAWQLAEGGPWGQGFPEPQFDNQVRVVTLRGVGRGHTRLSVAIDDVEVEAIAFNMDPDRVRAMGTALRMLYALEVNEYRGQQSVQLRVNHLLPLSSAS